MNVSLPTQTSSEFYERLISAITDPSTREVSLTSEAFYVVVYEMIQNTESPDVAEDVKTFLQEIAFDGTMGGVKFSELVLCDTDAIAATVTSEDTVFFLTLPKEYMPEISVRLGEDALEIDTDPSQDEVNDALQEHWDNVEAEDLEREDLEQAVEDARTQLQWAEQALQDVEDDVETARDELLKAKRALEDFNQE